jgi:hypothetical protein
VVSRPPATPPATSSAVTEPAGPPARQAPAAVAGDAPVSIPRQAAVARHPGPQIERVPFQPPAPDTVPSHRETTAVAAQPAAAPSAAAPPGTAPAPDPRPDIRAAFADYAAAIESQSLGSIRRVYPAMSAAQQQGWEQFFGAVRDVKATLSLSQVDVQGGTAEAQAVGSYTYLNTTSHRTEQRPVSFHVAFRRDAGGWRIAEIR